MSVTRLTKLKGYNNVLAGRDLANVLKEGHVYSITEVLGVIMINDLGEHAVNEDYKGAGLAHLMTTGTHCLTKEEYKKQLSRNS